MTSHHLVLLLFLVLSAVSPSAADWNVSIDCGASGSYIDSNLIEWIGDDSLIQTGERKEVEHIYRPFRSLRVFSTRKKNCYSINATKGDQVLIRASFYYGNYDNQSLAPTFELQFDGNFWAMVETKIDEVVSREAIYFVKGNAISVCVAQTRRYQLPFISALEVRSLALDMYARSTANSALYLQKRASFGASAIVRHPYDNYDRIWDAVNSYPVLTRKEKSILVNTRNHPPQEVLFSAITTQEEGFSFGFKKLPKDEVPISINLYFAEVDKAVVISPSKNRSFVFLKDTTLLRSEPIVPSYDNVTELNFANITASSETEFTFLALPYSAFPPILNALEIFVVSDPLTDGTYRGDVEGLAALQSQFNMLQQWQGDPCLPINYKWDMLNCSSELSPRITALNLSGYGLSGPLPNFSSMTAIQSIDLSNNSLTGPIPDFLGTLPNLKELNLANNNFSGPIPSSLTNKPTTNLKATGNPNLCFSPESCKTSGCGKQRNSLPTMFAASVISSIVSWVLCWI